MTQGLVYVRSTVEESFYPNMTFFCATHSKSTVVERRDVQRSYSLSASWRYTNRHDGTPSFDLLARRPHAHTRSSLILPSCFLATLPDMISGVATPYLATEHTRAGESASPT